MKQNLIQKQFRLSNSKPNNNKSIDKSEGVGVETIDLTSKAFFIANQIMEADYLFSKRALATFLHGKPIILQQKGNQRPPSSLKGYMSLHNDVLIENMIDLMIDYNILGEKRVSLKQRSTKRLFTTKKFQFENFPKIIMKSKQKKSIQLPFVVKIQKTQNQKQKQKQKSRLSSFLVTKTSLPINVEKRQIQIKMKTQKQKQEQLQRKRRQQQQIRLKRQQQIKDIQLQKQRLIEFKKKQKQKKLHLENMNNFWLKQKQKIESFISPSKLRNNNDKEKQQKQKIQNQKSCLQIAGNVLQMQMKELKQQQDQKKNPIKPYISWSFVKNTLGIDSSQSNNEKKQQITPVIEVKKQKISNQKSFKKLSQGKVNIQYCTFKKDKQQAVIEEKTPFLGIPQSYSRQIDQQEHSLSFNHSQSTDVTMTNYKLQKINRKKTKDQHQNNQIHDLKKQEIFAKNSEESLFSNSYYLLGDKGQQTVTNKKVERNRKSHIFNQENEKKHFFTFKRRSTLLANQQTFTVAKKLSKKNSYQNVHNHDVEDESQVQEKFFKRQKRQEKEQNDEIQHTMTLAVPKRMSQKRKTKDFMQVVFSQDIPKYDVEMFSQTITTPQPKTKNKKICTSDLYPIKTQYQQKQLKRDSFVEQLINDYFNEKKCR